MGQLIMGIIVSILKQESESGVMWSRLHNQMQAYLESYIIGNSYNIEVSDNQLLIG